jgi:hypothetical protein
MNVKYPIGPFTRPKSISVDHRKKAIQSIKDFPAKLENTLNLLESEDWERKYRPYGWNIRQLVHHLADSHMNAFIRFKLSISEINPIIKPYLEDKWADHSDYSLECLSASRAIISSVHLRWAFLLESFTETQWSAGYFHPDLNQLVLLDEALLQYQWHGNHHLNHIEIALEI